MDKKTYGIGILTLMAIVLFVANFMPIRTVQADEAVKERSNVVCGHGVDCARPH